MYVYDVRRTCTCYNLNLWCKHFYTAIRGWLNIRKFREFLSFECVCVKCVYGQCMYVFPWIFMWNISRGWKYFCIYIDVCVCSVCVYVIVCAYRRRIFQNITTQEQQKQLSSSSSWIFQVCVLYILGLSSFPQFLFCQPLLFFSSRWSFRLYTRIMTRISVALKKYFYYVKIFLQNTI